MRNLIVVPVLDGQGRAIGAIRAMNKQGKSSTTKDNRKFHAEDVQILKSLASHISVSLSSVYHDEDEYEVRLRDTIRILKEQGIHGMEGADATIAGYKRRNRNAQASSSSSLFPEDD